LLNEARLNKGLPSMGWMHPFLYDAAANNENSFIDITNGENPYGCCKSGFSAEKGWDAITGLGVPQFQTLLSIALNMQK
jgi:tripeptidyl-peptidase-1